MTFAYRRSCSPVSSLSSSVSSSSLSTITDKDSLPLLDPHKIPQVLPDLRFEQSYIASIRGFIHELEPEEAEREKSEALGEKGSSEAGEKAIVEARNPKGEPELWIGRLRIDWVPLLKATLRDQFLSPLLQGAAWGIFGLLLSNARSSAKAYFQELRQRRELARHAAAASATGNPLNYSDPPRPAMANVGLRASQIVGQSELR